MANNWISQTGEIYDKKNGLGTPRPMQPRRAMFLNGTNQYIVSNLESPITSYPFSLFGFVKKSETSIQSLVSISANSTSSNYTSFRIDEGNRVGVYYTGAVSVIQDVSDYINQWTSYVAVFLNSTTVIVYRNGELLHTFSGLSPMLLDSTFDRFVIGAIRSNSPSGYLAGYVQHCGFIRAEITLEDAKNFHSTGIIDNAEQLFTLDDNSTTVCHSIGIGKQDSFLAYNGLTLGYNGEILTYVS